MTNFQGSIAGGKLRLHQRVIAHIPLFHRASLATGTQVNDAADGRYRLRPLRTLAHSALDLAPPYWREAAAERWLRRKDAPGPASEHVFQYQLSARNRGGDARADCGEATVAKGADLFYERQYRQYLNATMGVFAMTAKLALLGCGGRSQGALWGRNRPVYAAMVEETVGAPPIIVLDHQTVAVPLLLPAPATADEEAAIDRWLVGIGADAALLPEARCWRRSTLRHAMRAGATPRRRWRSHRSH